MGGEAPQAVGAVGGQLDVVALHGQPRVQRLAVGLVVLDDEDAHPAPGLALLGAVSWRARSPGALAHPLGPVGRVALRHHHDHPGHDDEDQHEQDEEQRGGVGPLVEEGAGLVVVGEDVVGQEPDGRVVEAERGRLSLYPTVRSSGAVSPTEMAAAMMRPVAMPGRAGRSTSLRSR